METQGQSGSPAPRRRSEVAASDHDKLYERHYHLHNQRGETIATRIDVISQRSTIQQRVSDLEQTLEELSRRLKSFVPEGSGSEGNVPLLSAINNTQRQQEELVREMEQMKKLELHLNSLEYDLGKEEVGFFETLRTIVPALIKAAEAPNQPILRAPTPVSEHDLLKTYYDQVSDIPILEERIAELEDTFGEERAERETRTNLGEPISPPDLEFYSQYNQDKEDFARELSQKRNEVARLLSRCIKIGLLPQPSKPPSIDGEMELVGDEKVNKASSWSPGPNGSASPEQSFHSDGHELSIEDLPSLGSRRTRINEWLEGSPTARLPESLLVDEDPELRASETRLTPRSDTGTPLNDISSLSRSPLESPDEVGDAQLGQKRNISESSSSSRASNSEQEPPQKFPKPT